jgi:hypothetical protein
MKNHPPPGLILNFVFGCAQLEKSIERAESTSGSKKKHHSENQEDDTGGTGDDPSKI